MTDTTEEPKPNDSEPQPEPKKHGIFTEHDRCPACTRLLYQKVEKVLVFQGFMCLCPECGCLFVPPHFREQLHKQISSHIIVPGGIPAIGPKGRVG